MYLLFDETGKFLAGRILQASDASLQVELDSGKRVKVKLANALLRFEQPNPAELLAQAQALARGIELDMAWEFAPEGDFGFDELARDYFSAQATPVQQAAVLMALFDAPHYFRRAGKGRFRKASAEVLAQALAAIEKKQQIAAQVAQWAQALAQGECPASIRDQLYKILFKPDKNAPEYRAVVDAARSTHLGPLALLMRAGAIDSPYQFHWRRFLFEHFPRGTGFPKLEAPDITDALPLASVQAFSIDDSSTTEIDDALSVQGLGSAQVVVGVHIAAPALAIHPDSALDQAARSRWSTVYMPGYKLTMLPDEVVQRYTLAQGQDCPAVSLYATFDANTLDLLGTQTRLERVFIADNLRHDTLDEVVTLPWLQDPSFQHQNEPQGISDKREQLSFLYRLAQHLKAQREVVRGKPELFNRPDYSFKLIGNNGAEPVGDEQVEIRVRQRGAPLDLIVSEAMILANSTWGQWLAELGVPAIYRSQASMAPGIKVRMGTKALPHAGMGVKCYAWSTSPLRRYVDLVNQWQIIACARHGRTAALAAPFKPKDAALFAVISGFDAAYTAYNAYQSAIERFWTLRHLQQRGITELDAIVFKDNLTRADTLPLVLPVAGAQGLPRGARVRVRLGDVDLVALDVQASLLQRLDDDPAAAQSDEGAEDDEASVAGPIAIALDVDEAPESLVANPEAPTPQ
ncbi:MAG: RNB domain-containing ribonuclease [Rhodoferax sp.]